MTVASSFALSNGHDPSGLSNGNGHGDRDHDYVASLSSIADSLVQRAVSYYDEQYGFSTASPQVYDTAWVAMVRNAPSVAIIAISKYWSCSKYLRMPGRPCQRGGGSIRFV